MRIGIFTECYHPIMNGVVVSIDTFRKELEKQGHEYVIVTTGYPNFQDTEKNVLRIRALPFAKHKGSKYPIARPQSVQRWAKILEPYKLDIIHCQHLLSSGSLGLKVAKKLKIPAILTYHTLMTEYVHYVPFFGAFARGWIIRKSRNYGNQYNAIVTPGPSMARLLESYGVTTPITSIPTGINLESFQNPFSKEEVYQKWKIPQEHAKLLVYVSRIGKEKNIYFLLEAIKKLILEKNHRDVHVLLIGPGNELENCQQWVKENGIAEFTTFTGKLDKEETNRTLPQGKVFAFPSVTETQGIVVLEAMAAGVPQIAINQMGAADYVVNGVTGFLTSLKTDEFVDKIEYLLTHEDKRQEMVNKGLEEVKKYSSLACAQKMESLYEHLRNNHRPQ